MNNTAVKITEIPENFITNPDDGSILNIGFEWVTPALAIQYLSLNHNRNRKTNPATIAQYKNQLLKGLWVGSSGESIKFCESILIDGQHRLRAIIAANEENKKFKGIHLLVIRNVPESALNSIDSGHKRTLGNAFQIAGKSLPNQSSINVCLRVLYNIKMCVETNKSPEGIKHSHAPSTTELLQFFDQLPNFNKKMAQYFLKFKYTAISQIMPAGVCCAMWYLFSDKEEELTYSIFKGLESGIPLDGLGECSPVYRVYNRARVNRERKVRTTIPNNIMIFTWLFAKTLEGEKVKTMPALYPWKLDRKNPVIKLMTDKLISF